MQKCLQNGSQEICRQMQRLDVIANNLANMNTTGHKAQKVDFYDLINENTLGKSTLTGNNCKIARTSRDFSQGVVARCENPYSIAIQGKGFFKVLDEKGDQYYTRDGNFVRDDRGRLTNSRGCFLEGINIPGNTEKVLIRADGTVDYMDFQGEVTRGGQIKLYTFDSPRELKATGDNLFTANDLTGEIRELNPGKDGAAEVKQGFLEVSNTDWAMEMMNLIQTQRTIQINSQSVIKTVDQIWEMANNLRR